MKPVSALTRLLCHVRTHPPVLYSIGKDGLVTVVLFSCRCGHVMTLERLFDL